MKLNYPDNLPITKHREQILDAILKNQVVVIVGETGSGKSTQIPKMLLEALSWQEKVDPVQGAFKIVCTQPRRIAATSIATWIAEDMQVKLGQEVGYKIRFDDESSKGTVITICTDGILLQEMKSDNLLSDYDAVLVDEAHERNLNIDFLLGLLKEIQVKRTLKGLKKLKVVVTSATVDAQKFADFFLELNDFVQIPIVNVSGRTYPVEIKYAPLENNDNIYRKIADLVKQISLSDKPGDVLIFMPGEYEIFSTIRAIEFMNLRDVKVLPLYSRLTMEEQQQIFAPHQHLQVIVSTNIAETSLTVPGIIYVIDSGLARITDFNYRTGIGSLEVKSISRASAVQRAGRAGRVAAGHCIRLYSEDDFLSREEYTKPEIHRSDLASVVLHMILIGINDVYNFSFIDPPDVNAFRTAFRVLHELGALNNQNELTPLGFKMAHLPLEPRISAMLLASEKYQCVRQIAIIASSLSVKDPFLRPNGEEEEADAAKRYFQKMAGRTAKVRYQSVRRGRKILRKKIKENVAEVDAPSDLVTYLVVWNQVRAIVDPKAREEYCQSHYLNYQVIEEIEQIYGQLLDTLMAFAGEEFRTYLSESENEYQQVSLENLEGILKSIASGLLQNLCEQSGTQTYQCRGTDNILLHPGSALFTVLPKWFVAAEIVETTKLYARNNTAINPMWLEEIAPHLCEKKYGPIIYDHNTGKVLREETVFFRNKRLSNKKLTEVTGKDKVMAFEMFVREALVKRGLVKHLELIRLNEEQRLILKTYSAKAGQEKWYLNQQRLFDWYVVRFSAAKFFPVSEQELKAYLAVHGDQFLRLTVEEFIPKTERARLDQIFPDEVFLDGEKLKVYYAWEDYNLPNGPVLYLNFHQLVKLTEDKLAKLFPKSEFKPYLVIGNPNDSTAPVASSADLQELKEQYDRNYLKKFWKKKRKEIEEKSIRLAEVLDYLPRTLQSVEIGKSLFAEEGSLTMVQGYTALVLEGKKVNLFLLERLEQAQERTKEVLLAYFKTRVTQKVYFSEASIEPLQKIYEKYFQGVDILERCQEMLWQRLGVKEVLAEMKAKLNDVVAVQKLFSTKLSAGEQLSKEVLADLRDKLQEVDRLQSTQSGASSPEILLRIKTLKEQIEQA